MKEGAASAAAGAETLQKGAWSLKEAAGSMGNLTSLSEKLQKAVGELKKRQ